MKSKSRFTLRISQPYSGHPRARTPKKEDVPLTPYGARTSKFISSPMYGGLSAVESAVREMIASGVLVARRAEWKCIVPYQVIERGVFRWIRN